MSKPIVAFSAGIAGAGLMYILDPALGRRRRGLLMDKGSRFSKLLGRAVGTATRDVSHRVQGVVAKGTHLFKTQSVTDSVLVERIRSELGRVIFSPSSVTVKATNGEVILSGSVPHEEHSSLLRHVRKVPGVRFVHDRLQTDLRYGEPSIQGTGRFGRTRVNWTPATRAFAITAGVGAVLFGLSQRNTPGMLATGAGATFLTRAITNKPAKELVTFWRKAS